MEYKAFLITYKQNRYTKNSVYFNPHKVWHQLTLDRSFRHNDTKQELWTSKVIYLSS